MSKTSKKRKKQSKKQPLPRGTSSLTPEEKLVADQLKAILPIPSLSFPYLVKAITSKAKVFLTSDPFICQERSTIEKTFPIIIADNYAEAQEIIEHGKRLHPLEATIEVNKENENEQL